MAKPETPDYRLESAIQGKEHITAILPPVETDFREHMFDVLKAMGLLREVVVGGSFFETKHLTDGTPYSELRVPGEALEVTGQNINRITHAAADVLRDKMGKTADLSPYINTGSRKLFEEAAKQE